MAGQDEELARIQERIRAEQERNRAEEARIRAKEIQERELMEKILRELENQKRR